MVEKIATDLGARVSTKNLAWDAQSGEVLLTETINEYDDHYYSFNYPAYWVYSGMGGAYQNIGIEGELIPVSTPMPTPDSNPLSTAAPHFYVAGNNQSDLTKFFHVGDELYSKKGVTQTSPTLGVTLNTEHKLWVVGFNANKSAILLMDRNGEYINRCEDVTRFDFKIVRSGHRNIQTASMASITSMVNPIDINNDGNYNNLTKDSFIFDANSSTNPRIVNASAVEYNDFWLPQDESDLKYYPSFDIDKVTTETIIDVLTGNPIEQTINSNPIDVDGLPNYPYNVKVNPYLWNIKGDWKAEKSHAYLTGRKSANASVNNSRNEGFFTSFSPFYQLDTNKKWTKNSSNWTYASSVTKVSPYGAELENKDALNRYSAAQYGYQYKLPMAVASNSKYEQMGYEGFEEVKTGHDKKHFGFANQQNNLTNKYSHTGKSSLKVAKSTSTLLTKALFPKYNDIGLVECPVADESTLGCLLKVSQDVNTISLCIDANNGAGVHSITLEFSGNIISVGQHISVGGYTVYTATPTGSSQNLQVCLRNFPFNPQTGVLEDGYVILPIVLEGGSQCCVKVTAIGYINPADGNGSIGLGAANFNCN